MGLGNFTLVSGARFNPFTFDELLKPALMATEAHQKLEDAYGELATLANLIEGLANEQADHDSYIQLKKYSDDLKAQADALAAQGLTPTSRQDMLRMKARYSNEVVPVLKAYDWRLQLILNQAEGRAKGIVYEGDAASTSLDEYRKNPTLIYNAADTNAGLARLGNIAQALAKNLANAKITGKLDATTNALLQSSGYKTTDVQKAIADAQSDLLGVINGTIPLNSGNPAAEIVMLLLRDEAKASTVDKWNNANARKEYMNKVMPALYGLVGQQQITPIANQTALAYLHANAAQAAQKKTSEEALRNSVNSKLMPRGLRLSDDGKSIVDMSTGQILNSRDISLLGSPSNMLKDEGVIPASGSSGGSSGPKLNKAYDRPNTVYINGLTSTMLKDDDSQSAALNKVPFNVTVRGNRAYFVDGNKEVYYYDKTNNELRTVDENGDGVVVSSDKIKGGLFDKVQVKDLMNLGLDAVNNPGSENQYSYGITTTGRLFKDKSLVSLLNKSQDVTKGILDSGSLADQLLLEYITGGQGGYQASDSQISDLGSNWQN